MIVCIYIIEVIVIDSLIHMLKYIMQSLHCNILIVNNNIIRKAVLIPLIE